MSTTILHHRAPATPRPVLVLSLLAALTLAAAAPAAAAAAVAGAAGTDPAPRQTLRLDYFHTGGLGDEVFAVDRVVVEPLPWPGNPAGDVDPSGYGTYRFEVKDGGGRVVYARGFGPIFAEWVSTAEAREVHRTFHESVRFPKPDAPVEVVISKRGDDGAMHEVWQTPVDPQDMYVDPSPPPHREVLEIEHHGEPRDHVDLLLLGDGYTAEECAAKFPADARRMAAALFAHEPFATRRDDFNVWGICPPSPASGVSRPSTGKHVRSPLAASYDIFGSERYVLTYDNRAWRDVAAWAPYEFVTLLVNADTYGGGGLYNQFSTVAVDSAWADYLFVHEFGHHFAALADEYYTSPVEYEAPAEVREPWEPNVTALLDPEHLKWAGLVAAGTPLPTPWPKQTFEEHAHATQRRREQIRAENRPESVMNELFREQQAFETELLGTAEHAGEVGAFQGANYDAEAFYRPQTDCVMFTRDEVPFCAVCRHAIEAVIDLYAPPAP